VGRRHLPASSIRRAEEGLKAYVKRLRASNEELQRFAYVPSHDLQEQEPLRSILSFSRLLERRYKEKLDADADDSIAFIVEGGNGMQALIRGPLQLSRVETLAQPPMPMDENAAAADVIRALGRNVGDVGGTITVEPLPTVMADPPRLEQVLVNPVADAPKYRRPDVPPEVRLSAERRGDLRQFAVGGGTTGSGSRPSTSAGSSGCSSASIQRTGPRGRGSVSPSSRRSSSATAAGSGSSTNRARGRLSSPPSRQRDP
jgi:light-regulated signal transduction histidine kinase (bacteriophytochrome)